MLLENEQTLRDQMNRLCSSTQNSSNKEMNKNENAIIADNNKEVRLNNLHIDEQILG